MLGEKHDRGLTIFETDAVRMWTLAGSRRNDDVAIVSFKSKMHAIGADVLEGLNKAIDEAEANYTGLVIWQSEPPFAAGANLVKALESLQAGNFAEFEAMVAKFQSTSQRIKYSHVPVVSAVDGLALGGGCEFVMHSDRVIASLESYIGLVEAGVGLLPAGGGLKEIALRAALAANGGDVMPDITKMFKQIAMGEVSKSALGAKEMGYLRWRDVIILNRDELLTVAIENVRAMASSVYRPPLPPTQFPVAGDTGVATLKMILVNMKEGGFISEHDYEIGSRIATCLCGGDVTPGSMVDEKWMLDLERKHFVELAKMAKTQERIAFMLKNGKPLRN
jgi:3-hydroxyacyl-CoA dehydrogenase